MSNSSPSNGLLRTYRELRYYLSFLMAYWRSSIYSKFGTFLKFLNNGKHFSIDFDMNLLSAIILPVNLCTFRTHDGMSISNIAYAFCRLGSIPRLLTMYPRNFPLVIKKAHFVGFNFILYPLSTMNTFSKLAMCY